MPLCPRHLPVHMLKAHISVIYEIALLYFIVAAHELSAPGMLVNFPGFHSCLEIHICPQVCPLPPHTPQPPPLSQLDKDLTARPLLLPADPRAAFSIPVS